jgi:hypothetical protein
VEGRGPIVSFPYETFESAILTALREVDPEEVVGDGSERPDERLALAAELERVAAQVSRIKDNLLAGGDVSALADVLRQLEAKHHELSGQEQAARERAARPLSESWSETNTLLDIVNNAPDRDGARLRLRAALRRVVSDIWVLAVPRGRDRLCACQIRFTGGGQRDYLIWHRPPRSNGKTRAEGWWRVCSWRREALAAIGLDQGSLVDDPWEPEATEEYLRSFSEKELDRLVFFDCPAHPLS